MLFRSLYKLPTPKWKAPKRLDRSARWGKYLVLLVLVVLIPAFAVTDTGVTPPAFCKYLCPAGTLGGGIPLLLTNPSLRGLAGALFSWKTLILVLILAASVATERPFCRYLCPLGAFYGLFSRFSLFQVQLDKAKCVGCKKCEQACPMAVEVKKLRHCPQPGVHPLRQMQVSLPHRGHNHRPCQKPEQAGRGRAGLESDWSEEAPAFSEKALDMERAP